VVRHWKSLGCALVLVAGLIRAAGAGAGTLDLLPPKPADDVFADTAPITAADLQAARSDPRLQQAFELLMGGTTDRKQGADILKQLAWAGNPVAATGLCAALWQKLVVDIDDQIGSLCLIAAAKGYAPAQWLRSVGTPGETNGWVLQEANHWLRLAAKQGDAIAWVVLARNYALGKGVTADQATGTRLIDAVAALPSPIHFYALSTKYRRAIGVKKDLAIANAYLKQAADAGIYAAQLDLAIKLHLGSEGMPHDQAASDRWRERGIVSLLKRIRDWQPEMGQ
jgi:hypothetical protein